MCSTIQLRLAAPQIDPALMPVIAGFGALLLSGLLAYGCWSLAGQRLGDRSRHEMRTALNYRGEPVRLVGGLVLAFTVLALTALWTIVAAVVELNTAAVVESSAVTVVESSAAAVVESSTAAVVESSTVTALGANTSDWTQWIGYWHHALAALVLSLGFGVLGYIDDTRGTKATSGLVGHLSASLRTRRPTTAIIKLVGGLALSALGAWISLGTGLPDAGPPAFGLPLLLVAIIVIAGSANFANLLDRVPGRTAKASLLWWLVLAAVALTTTTTTTRAAETSALVLSAIAVGAAAGLLGPELRERHMLGDTGVNPLGATLGLATVVLLPLPALWLVAVALLAATALSESVSFSSVVDAVVPLAYLDRLGSPYRRTS